MDSKKLCLILLLSGLLFLVGTTVYNPNPLLFDEVLFPRNVELMEKHGFSEKFLTEMVDQSPGPLYQFIHLPLKSITNLKAPGIRVVNLVFLILIMVLLSSVIKNNFSSSYAPFLVALNIIAFPVMWQVSGLALTEIPAIFFVTAFLATVSHIYRKSWLDYQLLGMSLLAGVLLGFAVLGRTPFLVLLAPIFLILFYRNQFSLRQAVIIIVPVIVIPLAFILPIFAIWGGMVPPQQAAAGVEGDIKIWHAILGLAYGAILTLFVAPKWFFFNRSILYIMIASFVIIATVNQFAQLTEYYPMSVTIEKVFPGFVVTLYKMAIPGVIGSLGVYYGICCLKHMYTHRSNFIYVFSIAALLLLLLSNAKISHLFSSRYIAQAVPFMLVTIVPFEKITWSKSIRITIAMIVGFLSLNTYAQII